MAGFVEAFVRLLEQVEAETKPNRPGQVRQWRSDERVLARDLNRGLLEKYGDGT